MCTIRPDLDRTPTSPSPPEDIVPMTSVLNRNVQLAGRQLILGLAHQATEDLCTKMVHPGRSFYVGFGHNVLGAILAPPEMFHWQQ